MKPDKGDKFDQHHVVYANYVDWFGSEDTKLRWIMNRMHVRAWIFDKSSLMKECAALM